MANPPRALGDDRAARYNLRMIDQPLRLTKIRHIHPATWLALLLPIFAWAPLTYPGYFEFQTGFLPIFNLNDFVPQRGALGWAPLIGRVFDLWRGDGALPYRIAAAFRVLGASPEGAVKWVFAAGIVLGALGMYLWARRGLGHWAALVASTLYAFWPMALSTIYVRGAFAETLLLGLMPWVLWAADHVVTANASAGWFLLFALLIGVTFWTQAGLAMWLALALLAFLATGIRASRATTARRPLAVLLSWLGGILLGWVGLAPLILQHGWGGGAVSSLDGLISPYRLLEAGATDGTISMPYQIGVVAFGLAAAGIAFPIQPAPEGTRAPGSPEVNQNWLRSRTIFAALVTVAAAILGTTLSAPIWDAVPWLGRLLTAPWQLLLLAGLCLAWLAGRGTLVLMSMLPVRERSTSTATLAAALATLALLGSYGGLNPVSTDAIIPDQPVAVFGDNEIALLSADSIGVPGPGGEVTLLARWQGLRSMTNDYTVFVHVVGADGTTWGQQDTMPQGGAAPTSGWQPGKVMPDQYTILMSPDTPVGGVYHIEIGLYEWQSGERLRTATDDKVVLP